LIMAMNSDFDREVRFEILEEIGIITTHSTGWKKELNLVSWNGRKPKYDIREWSEDKSRMTKGVTLTGLKYPLTDHTISGAFPLGVSNEFTGAEASASVKEGSLLLLWEDKGDFYTLLPRLWPKDD